MTKTLILDDKERVGPWVAARAHCYWHADTGYAIGLERNGELVAGFIVDEYNGVNCCVHLAGVGKHWCNRMFIRAFFYYVFGQLGCVRATGFVPSDNETARRFDEHFGFELEATLKDAHPGGDLLVYVLRPDNERLKRFL